MFIFLTSLNLETSHDVIAYFPPVHRLPPPTPPPPQKRRLLKALSCVVRVRDLGLTALLTIILGLKSDIIPWLSFFSDHHRRYLVHL